VPLKSVIANAQHYGIFPWNDRTLYQHMSNQIILITGCQRSGTTLLHLILDSHPEVHGIDEMQFNPQRTLEYINSPGFAPCISFKLPVASHAFGFIESLPDRKILWCVRAPA